jgi:arylsulfatase A-like enzyme
VVYASQVGKWHVGSAKRSMLPLSRGFGEFYGLHGGGFDHYTKARGPFGDRMLICRSNN